MDCSAPLWPRGLLRCCSFNWVLTSCSRRRVCCCTSLVSTRAFSSPCTPGHAKYLSPQRGCGGVAASLRRARGRLHYVVHSMVHHMVRGKV